MAWDLVSTFDLSIGFGVIAIGTFDRVRHQFEKNAPDSGQNHRANEDNGFLVTVTDFDMAMTVR